MAISPVESFEDISQRFPGVEQLDPKAVGKFVFFSAGNFPEELYKAEVEAEDRHWREPQQETWKSEVTQLLVDVRRWRQERQLGSVTTRYGLAKSAEQAMILTQESTELVETLKTVDADTGFDAAADYLDKWGFKVGIDIAPSPLFPEGRYVRRPASDYVDREKRYSHFPYGKAVFRTDASGNEAEHLDDTIKDYLDKDHAKLLIKQRIRDAFETLEGISPDVLQELREKYGAKSANLTVFKDVLERFYQAVGEEDGVQKIEIPPYKAIGTDMFEAWANEEPEYDAMLEEARQSAIKLAGEAYGGLVAIRSSAVYSEDGNEHTGAGIYHSAIVDPSDAAAFQEAVTKVYASTTSPDALAYQASCGVSRERMGLLLQAYVEEERGSMSRETYGFINSRGANPNIIEAHTPVGTVLFDKPKLSPSLLLDRWHDGDDYLHSTPDHSKELRHMPNQVISAVHAALLAELLLQSPVQVEYVAGGQVVQVRPLPMKSFEGSESNVSFPEDLQEIVRSKSIGIGDLVLEELDDHRDNSDKEGFVIFWSEYGFTDSYNRSHRGLSSLPNKGAVVILNHSDSGHIQTLCQEKGLMCFYPDSKLSELDGLKDYLDDTRDSFVDDDFEDDFSEPKSDQPRKLRFVADGYHGRIYSVLEP